MRESAIRSNQTAPPTAGPTVTGLLQRKCSCGGSPRASGECAECKKRKELQRSASKPSSGGLAPPVVHDVLRTSGRSLDAATRAYMEPRFGHNFGNVRIHDDSCAAESARAVDAHAYTVANKIVFGEGQFSPTSYQGRRLLGHELSHVVQQSRSLPSSHSVLRIGPVNDPLEQEADRRADQLDAAFTGFPPALSSPPESAGRVQRAPRTPSGSAPDAGPSGTPPVATKPAAPSPICGPDVTVPTKKVMAAMNAAWGGWNANQREEACWSLENFKCGPEAWDIVELHNNAWIYQDYRPACASAGASPPCGSTVQVDSDCHDAGALNYVIFGRMCDLCDIWKFTMHRMIDVHKAHFSGFDRDYDGAVDWADAGYHGWPGSASPAGRRNDCKPSCSAAFGPTANLPTGKFDFNWVPTHTTETTSGECDSAVDLHRDLRDNPPDYSAGGLM